MTKASEALMPGDTPWTLPAEAKVYIFDLETDGLLDKVSKVHSLVVRDYWTGELVGSVGYPKLNSGHLELLAPADYLVAHNGFQYDYRVLEMLFGWKPYPGQVLLDTLPLARLIYSYLDDLDSSLVKTNRLPGQLYGSHGLKAWGIRLGEHKGDYTDWCKQQGIEDPWAAWTPEMQTYCEQDTVVTQRLLQRLLSRPYSTRSVELELELARQCAAMHFNGFPFDVKRAQELHSELSGLAHDAERRARDAFGSWWVGAEPHRPSRARNVFIADDRAANLVNRATKKAPDFVRGYFQGFDPCAPFTPITRVDFNPASRQHIAKRLIDLHGWSPGDFTETGQPKVDETTLKGLPWPEAKELARLFVITKTLGQLGNGQNAWLKLVGTDARIHGSINPNGAVTGRATHSRPNIAQVPSVELDKDGHPLWGEEGAWGADCRSLFTAPAGRVLVGSDLSKLELLCLAHFLARFDGGQYCDTVLSGDPHTFMQKAAGVDTRQKGKTLNYCLIYGGGDMKLGHTADPNLSERRKIERGRMIRGKIMGNFTGYKQLVEACQGAHKRGFLYGLDGRRVHIRHQHSAVNTLLQSAGALIAKRWIVELVQLVHERGIPSFELHTWVHDELQMSCLPQDVEKIKEASIEAAGLAGKYFRLRVPILAEAKHGPNWQATH